MTIKQQFSNILPHYSVKDNNNKSMKCITLADELTIGFTKWKDAKYYFDGYYVQLSNNFRTTYTINELLEIYKKEKGL